LYPINLKFFEAVSKTPLFTFKNKIFMAEEKIYFDEGNVKVMRNFATKNGVAENRTE